MKRRLIIFTLILVLLVQSTSAFSLDDVGNYLTGLVVGTRPSVEIHTPSFTVGLNGNIVAVVTDKDGVIGKLLDAMKLDSEGYATFLGKRWIVNGKFIKG